MSIELDLAKAAVDETSKLIAALASQGEHKKAQRLSIALDRTRELQGLLEEFLDLTAPRKSISPYNQNNPERDFLESRNEEFEKITRWWRAKGTYLIITAHFKKIERLISSTDKSRPTYSQFQVGGATLKRTTQKFCKLHDRLESSIVRLFSIELRLCRIQISRIVR